MPARRDYLSNLGNCVLCHQPEHPGACMRKALDETGRDYWEKALQSGIPQRQDIAYKVLTGNGHLAPNLAADTHGFSASLKHKATCSNVKCSGCLPRGGVNARDLYDYSITERTHPQGGWKYGKRGEVRIIRHPKGEPPHDLRYGPKGSREVVWSSGHVDLATTKTGTGAVARLRAKAALRRILGGDPD